MEKRGLHESMVSEIIYTLISARGQTLSTFGKKRPVGLQSSDFYNIHNAQNAYIHKSIQPFSISIQCTGY